MAISKKRKSIPASKQRAVRVTLPYQVIMDDICALFGADKKVKDQIEQLINGKSLEQVIGAVV